MTAPRRLAAALQRARDDDAQQHVTQATVTAVQATTVTVDMGGDTSTWPILRSCPTLTAGDVVWLMGPPGAWVCVGPTGAPNGSGGSGVGEQGPPGVSVTGATVNGAGHLIITLSSSTTIDAGPVRGAPGADGAAGPANTLDILPTTTGAAGTDASVTISGTPPNQHLAFTIPRGADGRADSGDSAAIGGQWGFYGDGTTNQSVPANSWTTMVPGAPVWANGVTLDAGAFTFAQTGVYKVDATAWWNTGTGLRITCIGPTAASYATRYGMARQTVSPSADLAQTVSATLRVTDTSIPYGVGLFSVAALTVNLRVLGITRVGAT